RPKRIRQLLDDLLTHLPPDSVIVLESGKGLDATILPDLDLWDVRRYGGTQLAIRSVGDRLEREHGDPSPDAPDDGDPTTDAAPDA
ncbi:MAG: hypothetical protein AB7I30_22310, partial [Isosphaeraceae bacterium]